MNQSATEQPETVAVDQERGGGGCIVSKTVNGCGPYLYRVTKTKGRQKWTYLGRADGLVRGRLPPSNEGPRDPKEEDRKL